MYIHFWREQLAKAYENSLFFHKKPTILIFLHHRQVKYLYILALVTNIDFCLSSISRILTSCLIWFPDFLDGLHY